jgi:hypothetical protein
VGVEGFPKWGMADASDEIAHVEQYHTIEDLRRGGRKGGLFAFAFA